MSVANQKVVFINRTTPKNKKYFKIDQQLFFAANARLSQAGMTMYMYFMTIVPDSYDNIPNKDNNRLKPFELSSSYAAEVIKKDVKTVQRGINNLIENGYLIQRKENIYQFIDILPEDKSLTEQETEKVLDYTKELNDNLIQLQQERKIQLRNISADTLKREQKKTLPIYDWQTEEEQIEILKYNNEI